MNMWVHHVQHLIRIAQHRKGRTNGVLQSYILWYVLYLDKQACLSGNGNADFVRAIVNNDLAMPNWARIFATIEANQQSLGNEESPSHAEIFDFTNKVCMEGAKLCHIGLELRSHAAIQTARGLDHQVLAARLQQVTQFQNELYATYHRHYPSYLMQPNPDYAIAQLPHLARTFWDFVSRALFWWSNFYVGSNTFLYRDSCSSALGSSTPIQASTLVNVSISTIHNARSYAYTVQKYSPQRMPP